MDGTHQWGFDRWNDTCIIMIALYTCLLVRYPCGVSDIVVCSGHYGHEYPFNDVLDGVRILWGFMKNYNTS